MRLLRSLVLVASVSAAAAEEWTVFRSGPFEVVTKEDRNHARRVLNHLEQFRHTYGQVLNTGKELVTLWPVRITVGKATTDLTLRDDFYTASIAKGAAVPRQWNRALALAFLQEATPRMPAPIEKGLVDFFTTLQVDEVKVLGGAPPEQPDRDWARIHLLMVSDEYYGRLRSLLYNLQQGAAPEPAYRNSLGKTAPEIEKEVDAWFAKKQFATVRLNAKPINLERDFSPRAWDPAKNGAPGAMAAFDAGDFERALQLKPEWPAAKFRLAQKKSNGPEKLKLLEEAAQGARREASYWRVLAETQIAEQKFTDALRSWSAAERAAANDSERQQIRETRASLEEQRVQYAIDEKQRKKEAAEAELNRLKNDALADIRKAEAKANAALGGVDPNAPKPVPWWDDPKADGKITGTLERVDCGTRGQMTLAVRDELKKLWLIALPADPAKLRLQGAAEATFACGVQRPPRKVTVQYFALKPARPGITGEAASVIF